MNSSKRASEGEKQIRRRKRQKKDVEEESNSGNSSASDCSADDINTEDLQKDDNGGATGKLEPTEDDSPVSENNENKHSEDENVGILPVKDDVSCGTLLFSGATNWDLVGRKELPKNAKAATGENLWGPHKLSALKGVRVSYVASGNTASHSAVVTELGEVMTWGRNSKGQLGHNDTERRDSPVLVDALKGITVVSVACGRSHTVFLTDTGTAYSCGDNKMGQCGVGSQNNTIDIPTKITFKGRPIAKIACGAEFSIILDMKGGLHSFGLPEYGQLGHNSTGQYFVTSSKMSFSCEVTPRRIIAYIEKTREGHVTLVNDVHIVDMACGINHCVALDSKKRCFSWGFGGYGRLGHSEAKDEMVPRLIKTFDGPNRGVQKVFAGGTFSMAINEYDVLYFWGQHKKSGEATMYPKPVPDLTGWKVRGVGCCNTSIIVVAEDSVITWGPSPASGELCYGDNRNKSSTAPQEAKTLDGLHIMQVACGYAHTMFIVRDSTEQDKAKLCSIPEFKP